MTKRIPVAIIGSCATRDAIDFSDKIELVDYTARSSFAHNCSNELFPVKISDYEAGSLIASNWQRKMVARDLTRELRHIIPSLCGRIKAIVVDFVDERFDLVAIGGLTATKSLEFQKTGIHKRDDAQIIRSGSPEHLRLLEIGFNKFYNIVKDHKIEVIVNNVFWAKKLNNNENYPKDESYIDSSNDTMEKIYQFVRNFDVQFVGYGHPSDFVADPHHRWGMAPFHYEADVYRKIVSDLEAIDSVPARAGYTGP